jgi:site-specific recombinase XerC
MAKLKIGDLDLNGRRLRVVGKGNKVGVAPFSAKTAKVLWAWLTIRKTRAKADHLWVTEEGNAFSIEGLVSLFVRLKIRASVNGLGGIHRLRHTSEIARLLCK